MDKFTQVLAYAPPRAALEKWTSAQVLISELSAKGDCHGGLYTRDVRALKDMKKDIEEVSLPTVLLDSRSGQI